MTRPAPLRAAFTLIELLLVLALLVVIAGFTVMTLEGSILRSKLRKGVDQVRTAWSEARLDAIASRERVAFTCMVGGRAFRLSPIDSMLTTPGEAAVAAGEGELPEGIVFRTLEAAPNTPLTQADAAEPPREGQWSSPVVFNADGTSYDAVLVLEESTGKQVQVSLRGLTCSAQVADVLSPRER